MKTEVLDVSSLDQEPSNLIYIAQAIKTALKNGAAHFEDDGRIHIPKELFGEIVANSKNNIKGNNPGIMGSGPFHYKMPEITKISV